MLSLSMIVKNEERYLEDCLKSVKGVVDEIVIVDTGSVDGTKSIAEKYGARIYDFKWVNDFSAARNYALEKSKGNWILYLDADERLSPESVVELKKLTSHEKTEAYYCRVVSIDDVKNRPSVMSYVRLFPKYGSTMFEGAVHEQIEYSLERNDCTIKDSGIDIIHVGYNISEDEIRRKAERNLSILKDEFARDSSSYYALQLAQTYGILQDKDKAVFYFTEALKDDSLKPEYKSVAYRYLAVDKAENRDWEAAQMLISKSLDSDDMQPLALLVASNIRIKLKDYSGASKYCLKAYEVNRKFLSSKSKSHQAILMDEEGILIECMNISMSLGDLGLFRYFFEKLKGEASSINDPDKVNELKLFNILLNNERIKEKRAADYFKYINPGNLDIIVTLLNGYPHLDTRIEFLREIAQSYPTNSVILNRLGLSLTENGEYAEAEAVFKKSFKANGNDPGTIFYMASVLLKQKKMNEIVSLIEEAERLFKGRNEVVSRLNTLKQKLGILHQN